MHPSLSAGGSGAAFKQVTGNVTVHASGGFAGFPVSPLCVVSVHHPLSVGGSDVLLAAKRWLARASLAGQSDVYVFFAGHGLASDDGERCTFFRMMARQSF